MAIAVKQNVFTLCTKNSMYQMKADEHGVLLHTYYGKKTEQMDFSYLIQKRDHGFSGNPYDAEADRKYSLDTLPQEYSCSGNGDYRESAFAVRNQYGAIAADLRFQGYEVLEGKYAISGLPAFYAENSAQADTLVISMKDRAGEIVVKLYYGVFEEFDLITRAVCVENCGEEAVYLERVLSCCVDQTYGNWDWMTFYGKHEMERQVSRTAVHHGIQSVGSLRGLPVISIIRLWFWLILIQQKLREAVLEFLFFTAEAFLLRRKRISLIRQEFLWESIREISAIS